MKFLLILSITISATCGLQIKWTDFRGGAVALPTCTTEAKKLNWVVTGVDQSLGVTWYKYNEQSVFLAYSEKGSCAAIKLIVKESDIDPNFLSSYKWSKGIFEPFHDNGVKYYIATLWFQTESQLKKGGLTYTSGEVATNVYIKRNNQYISISNDGCVTAKTLTEQSCQSSYGVILSAFSSSTKCTELPPYWGFYDPTAEKILGVGLVSFQQVSSSEKFLKQITAEDLKVKFPHTPSCLSSCKQFAVLEIFFNYSASQKTTCSSSTKSWVSTHCKKSKKYDSDSSSSSGSSDSDSSSSSSDSDSS